MAPSARPRLRLLPRSLSKWAPIGLLALLGVAVPSFMSFYSTHQAVGATVREWQREQAARLQEILQERLDAPLRANELTLQAFQENGLDLAAVDELTIDRDGLPRPGATGLARSGAIRPPAAEKLVLHGAALLDAIPWLDEVAYVSPSGHAVTVNTPAGRDPTGLAPYQWVSWSNQITERTAQHAVIRRRGAGGDEEIVRMKDLKNINLTTREYYRAAEQAQKAVWSNGFRYITSDKTAIAFCQPQPQTTQAGRPFLTAYMITTAFLNAQLSRLAKSPACTISLVDARAQVIASSDPDYQQGFTKPDPNDPDRLLTVDDLDHFQPLNADPGLREWLHGKDAEPAQPVWVRWPGGSDRVVLTGRLDAADPRLPPLKTVIVADQALFATPWSSRARWAWVLTPVTLLVSIALWKLWTWFERDRQRAAAQAKEEAKKEVVEKLDHDLREIPNSILLESRNLRATRSLSSVQIKCQYWLLLLDDLLAFSQDKPRGQSQDPEPHELQKLLRQTLKMASLGVNRSLVRPRLHVERGVPARVVVKAQHLQRALINLLKNAILATAQTAAADNSAPGKGGNIWLSVTSEPAGANRVILHLSVRDEGAGIPPHQLERIFQPYYSTTPGGRGLGLAIVKNLAEDMGGTIRVASSEGEGSVFTLGIPVEIAGQAAAEGRGRVNEGGGETLLLVDDDSHIAKNVKNQLVQEGFQVEVAASAAGALRALEGGRYDAVLMDLHLGDDVDGLEATRRLRARELADGRARIPVFALTAGTVDQARQETCRQAGMDDVFSKAIDPRVLAQRVRARLREPGWPGAAAGEERGEAGATPLDPRRLRDLVRTEAGRGLKKSPILADLDALYASLRAELNLDRAKEAARAAHHFAGWLEVNLGASRTADLASQLCTALERGEASAQAAALLDEEWTRARQFLAAHVPEASHGSQGPGGG